MKIRAVSPGFRIRAEQSFQVYRWDVQGEEEWFYVALPGDGNTIRAYPKAGFEISDPRPSKWWRTAERGGVFVSAHPETLDDEVTDWAALRASPSASTVLPWPILQRINVEYPDPDWGLGGMLLPDGRVRCPFCGRPFEPGQADGMVTCANPRCNAHMVNPLWVDGWRS